VRLDVMEQTKVDRESTPDTEQPKAQTLVRQTFHINQPDQLDRPGDQPGQLSLPGDQPGQLGLPEDQPGTPPRVPGSPGQSNIPHAPEVTPEVPQEPGHGPHTPQGSVFSHSPASSPINPYNLRTRPSSYIKPEATPPPFLNNPPSLLNNPPTNKRKREVVVISDDNNEGDSERWPIEPFNGPPKEHPRTVIRTRKSTGGKAPKPRKSLQQDDQEYDDKMEKKLEKARQREDKAKQARLKLKRQRNGNK
jgi:hypothetical protein